MKDQHAIVGTLGMLDRKIQKEEQRHVAIITFFNTLLHHLMTGKVRLSVSGIAGKAEVK